MALPALFASLSQPPREAATAVEAAVTARPSADADPLLAPGLILLLCILAGLGTVMLLPGRFSVAWRRLGGLLALVAGVSLFLAFGVAADTRPAIYFWIFSAIALVGSIRVITHPQPVYSALYFVLTVFASAGLFVLLWGEFMAAALVVIYAGAILVTYTFVIMLAADAAPAGPTDTDEGPEDPVRRFLAEHDRQARNPVAASAIGFVTMGVLLFVIFDRAPGTLEPRLSVTDPAFMTAPDRGEPVDAMGELVAAEAEDVSTEATAPSGLVRGDLYPANEQASYTNERGGVQTLGIYLFTRQMVSLQLAGLILTVAMVGAIVIARKQVLVFGSDGRRLAQEETETFTTPFTPASDDPKSLPVQGIRDPRQKAYPQN